jgi:hypothetical protein
LFAISPVRVQQAEKPLLATLPIVDKKNCPDEEPLFPMNTGIIVIHAGGISIRVKMVFPVHAGP